MKKIVNLADIKADLWAFDNDGTLYNNPIDLELAVSELMIQYVALYYGISFEEAKERRKQFLQKHNTKYTLIALKLEGIPEDDFIQKTYLSVNPVNFGITASPELESLISSLAGERIVLTNNPSEFASLILESLGIKHLFSKIVGMRERNYIQKPDVRAFDLLKYWIESNKVVALIDDCSDNIAVAKSLGCITLHAKGGLL